MASNSDEVVAQQLDREMDSLCTMMVCRLILSKKGLPMDGQEPTLLTLHDNDFQKIARNYRVFTATFPSAGDFNATLTITSNDSIARLSDNILPSSCHQSLSQSVLVDDVPPSLEWKVVGAPDRLSQTVKLLLTFSKEIQLTPTEVEALHCMLTEVLNNGNREFTVVLKGEPGQRCTLIVKSTAYRDRVGQQGRETTIMEVDLPAATAIVRVSNFFKDPVTAASGTALAVAAASTAASVAASAAAGTTFGQIWSARSNLLRAGYHFQILAMTSQLAVPKISPAYKELVSSLGWTLLKRTYDTASSGIQSNGTSGPSVTPTRRLMETTDVAPPEVAEWVSNLTQVYGGYSVASPPPPLVSQVLVDEGCGEGAALQACRAAATNLLEELRYTLASAAVMIAIALGLHAVVLLGWRMFRSHVPVPPALRWPCLEVVLMAVLMVAMSYFASQSVHGGPAAGKDQDTRARLGGLLVLILVVLPYMVLLYVLAYLKCWKRNTLAQPEQLQETTGPCSGSVFPGERGDSMSVEKLPARLLLEDQKHTGTGSRRIESGGSSLVLSTSGVDPNLEEDTYMEGPHWGIFTGPLGPTTDLLTRTQALEDEDMLENDSGQQGIRPRRAGLSTGASRARIANDPGGSLRSMSPLGRQARAQFRSAHGFMTAPDHTHLEANDPRLPRWGSEPGNREP